MNADEKGLKHLELYYLIQVAKDSYTRYNPLILAGQFAVCSLQIATLHNDHKMQMSGIKNIDSDQFILILK